MWRCHIICYASGTDRKKILDALNAMPTVVNWRASTGGIFIVANANINSNQLATDLHSKIPELTFVLAGIGTGFENVQGSTDKETWEFINFPRPAGWPVQQ